MRVLVTGGAGFIGSHFVRRLLARGELRGEKVDRVTVLDKLTYAGNRENLADVERDGRFRFVRGDIAAPQDVHAAGPADVVVNFAAETHVDRAVFEPGAFVRTDVVGVHTLLESVRSAGRAVRFLQVSTDEVYGSTDRPVREDAPLAPSSPYAASKASGDLIALSYAKTFDLDVVVTRASNNYGPFQHPEKLIPLMTTNALQDLPLPVYGDGKNERDWLHVEDHVEGLFVALEKGAAGEIYNIGAGDERSNIEVVRAILAALGKDETLIRFVKDRPAHDRRYSLDSTKLRALGWAPRRNFEEGLVETVRWYRDNEAWWRKARGGEFEGYYVRQYGERT